MRFAGETFGRYRILSRLAGGEMYLCEMGGAEGFARRVVLKKATGGGTLVLDRIRTAATLNHPNLAQLVDLVRLADGDYLVNEFVPGRSLRELQQRTASLERPVPVAALASIGAQAARVLGWLHGRQPPRPHGALTPRNLMLGQDGGLKLTDFGSSAWARETNAPLEVRRYRAPEWKPGGSMASDVFALGVVLWELLTNSPFEGTTEVSLEVPAPVRAILQRAVSAAPEDRPSARELEEVLMQCARTLAASIDELNIAHLLSLVFDSGDDRHEATQLTFAPSQPPDSPVLAGFQVGERLARLGSSELLRAQKAGWSSVLKVQVDAKDQAGNARLLAEARLLSRISHPSVLSPTDLAQTPDGRAVVVAKGMGGETAARLIERIGGLKPAWALALTRDLLGAVASVHAVGHTGASLDAETVFICTDTDPFHAVLVELGLARPGTDLKSRQSDIARVGQMLSVLLDAQAVPPPIAKLAAWLTSTSSAGPQDALEARRRTEQVQGALT